ncbi:hypothetical protein BDW59DRAFT_168319 [Aspergillus cavernicola]|uniref:UbiA prenyltransferase family n=1 Tax=Aspergillus cavernicola TaxID=176166 RepID=A0ABR4J794_9EURO
MPHPLPDNHYTGNQRSGWLKSVPDSALPFVQLARLSPPAGLFLIYFPHLFGLLLAVILTELPAADVVHESALLLGASFFVSNAIHTWNDLIDASLDAQVERTCKRPIPSGGVSPEAAFGFALSQSMGAGHTYYPQLVLGFCLSWGVVMGCLAVGFPIMQVANDDDSFRTDIYDTIYAHQDITDDKKAGTKSLAVLYGAETKPLLWQLLVAKTALLVMCGRLGKMSVVYYLLSVFGAAASLGSCWWWFGNGFWLAGGSIVGGLAMELVVQMY